MRVAIVGCGQLARMMAQVAPKLGIEVVFLAEPGENTDCVTGLGAVVERDPEATPEALFEALGRPQVLTVEREQVDVTLLNTLQTFCEVRPSPQAVANTQHRLREKNALSALGIPVAPFRPATDLTSLELALAALGYPAFVKGCEQGYDGKNQWRVKAPAELPQVAAEAGGQALVVEGRVDFAFEMSVIGARGPDGETVIYPPARNFHLNGTLLWSRVPAGLSGEQQATAVEYLERILNAWDYVGVLAMECFVTADAIVVNELAPRVHNSGHWSQDGAAASQFENHLRAICGLPLGGTEAQGEVAMLNLLGVAAPPADYQAPAARVHLYDKSPRPGRKMGHINWRAATAGEADALLREGLRAVYPELAPGDAGLA